MDSRENGRKSDVEQLFELNLSSSQSDYTAAAALLKQSRLPNLNFIAHFHSHTSFPVTVDLKKDILS